MPPSEPSEEENMQPLPEANQPPFTPATPAPPDSADPTDATGQASAQLDDTHPSTDSNLQPEEIYEAGLPGAAEAQEPNVGNAVTGYTPEPVTGDEEDMGAL